MDGFSGNGSYRRLLENSPAGLLVTTVDGEILEANRASAEFLGFGSPEELKQTNVRDHYVDLDQRREMIEELRETGTVEGVELLMQTREGHEKWLLTSVSADYDEQLGETVLLGTWVDITEQRELRERLEHRARHDPLTGLLNRRALFDRSEQVLAMCEREDRGAAVAYLDLVGFRQANEQVGHQGGDQILVEVGERIRDTVRDADLVARLGGDEFVIVATLIRDEDDADQVGRRLTYAFEDPFESAGTSLRLQPAVGVAVFPEDGTDMDTLLHRADRALWGPERRKAPGVRRYRRHLRREEVTAGWQVHEQLRRALQRDDELFQVYQPVVAAGRDDVVGLESLVRWRHPERGVLSPGTFIPEAEASGMIRELDRAVCRETARQAAAWTSDGIPVGWVSVNLSAQSLSDPDCLQWIGRAVEEHPELDPGQIVIEITEHTAMREASRTDTLQRLKDELGISISIDDFGIGYSSLLYLRRFPADFLKIDREFVQNLTASAADQKVVRGILSLGNAFDMRLIAEGVETDPQQQWLREAGCHYLQGYHFGRPAPPEEIETRLLDRR